MKPFKSAAEMLDAHELMFGTAGRQCAEVVVKWATTLFAVPLDTLNIRVVLVHGAFADSDSWNGLIGPLRAAGHRVIAYANPLRGVATDAAPLSDLLRTVDGPIVLIGHSYGGAVLTAVDPGAGDITAAVYVAGFALQPGESAADASPGSDCAVAELSAAASRAALITRDWTCDDGVGSGGDRLRPGGLAG